MGRGTSKANGGGGGGGLSKGEEAYVSLPPNSLNRNGQVIVAKTSDDRYIYKGGFDKNDYRVDKNSAEYKRALRDYNVNAKFHSDGSVTVTKGGLYNRKKNFKSVDDFHKESEKRLNESINYNKIKVADTKKGYIPQIQAENIKSIVRNNSTAQAMQKIGKEMQESINYSNVRIAAAQDMKQRLNVAVSKTKK